MAASWLFISLGLLLHQTALPSPDKEAQPSMLDTLWFLACQVRSCPYHQGVTGSLDLRGECGKGSWVGVNLNLLPHGVLKGADCSNTIHPASIHAPLHVASWFALACSWLLHSL